MKKILILALWFNWWWAWKIAALMENFLSESYETTTLIFFDDTWVFHIKWKKININIFPKKSFPWLWYILLIPHIISTIKHIKKEKPDIVISIWTYCNFLWLVAKKFVKFKLLLTQHEWISARKAIETKISSLNLIFHIIKKLIWNNKIVCVSDEVRIDSIKHYWIKEDQAITIYNWLDFNEIKKLWNEINHIHDKYIINIWTLCMRKNQEMLIKAYSQTKCKNEYKLVLLWEWSQKQYLEELAKRLNIKENVIFLWFQKNPYHYLKHASLFCFTSYAEALPTVLIEALILWVPIITVPVVWSNEILNKGKCGYILDNWDTNIFAKKIDEIIDKDNSNIIQEWISFSENNFSIEQMKNRYLNVLKNI